MGIAAATALTFALSGPQVVGVAVADDAGGSPTGPAAGVESASLTAPSHAVRGVRVAAHPAVGGIGTRKATHAASVVAARTERIRQPKPAALSAVAAAPNDAAAAIVVPAAADSAPTGSAAALFGAVGEAVAKTWTTPASTPIEATASGDLTAARALPLSTDPQAAAAALGGSSAEPLGAVLQAAAAQILGDRRTRQAAAAASVKAGPVGVAAAQVPPNAVAALPITIDNANSFTTIYGTTAGGSVTVNGHTWVADPTTHLYTTTTDLAQEWQANYAQMKAGGAASLNDIQRLEGNAEAVFENTALKSVTAAKLSADRQDVQRQFDAMYAAMVGAGVDVGGLLTQSQYLAIASVLQGNPTLLELGVQGHGLNNSAIARYSGYTKDFQNSVDGQTLYVGGGLNNGKKAIANFFDDNILSHMPFPTAVNNGVLWQLNQNGNRENTVAEAVAALNAGLSKTYLTSDFLQPPQIANQTPKQVFMNGQAFSFTLPADTFVDLQGQAMTYTATLAKGAALPSWVSFNAATGQFSGTPPAGTTPTRVYVTATNSSGLHTTEAFEVQFKEPAPVLAHQTATQTAKAGSTFSFTIAPDTFTDPLGQSLTYSANLSGGAALPSWLTFNAQTGQFTGSAPAGTKSVKIVLRATNTSGVKTAETFAIKFTA